MKSNDPAAPAQKFFARYAAHIGPRADYSLVCAECNRVFEQADGNSCPFCESKSISPLKPNAYTVKTLAARRDEAPAYACERCDDNSCEECYPYDGPGVV